MSTSPQWATHVSEVAARVRQAYLGDTAGAQSEARDAESRRAAVGRVAHELAAATGRPVAVDPPANVQLHYRLVVGFQDWMARDDLSEEFMAALERHGPATFLEVLVGVAVPAAEATWHRFSLREDRLAHDVAALESVDSTVPPRDARRIADRLAAVACDAGVPLIPLAVSRAPADSDLPTPVLPVRQRRLRHYLFPGCSDD